MLQLTGLRLEGDESATVELHKTDRLDKKRLISDTAVPLSVGLHSEREDMAMMRRRR